jgi:predicted transcriptional regulator
MEIVLSDVWERRLETMAEARGQSEDEIVEEALTTLYFMITRDASTERDDAPPAS